MTLLSLTASINDGDTDIDQQSSELKVFTFFMKKMSGRSSNKDASRHTCPLCMYELAQPIIIIVNPYRPDINELQLLRRNVVYDTTIYLRYAARELGESNLYVWR